MKFSEPLRNNRKFREIYKEGRYVAGKYLAVHVLANNGRRNHLGITVSKKVGNAVTRNRVTRLIRESYRLHEMMFNSGLDIVVVARVSSNVAAYNNIARELRYLAARLQISKNVKTRR